MLSRAEYLRLQTEHGFGLLERGSVCKTDVTVAKNYLAENEITELNRIVIMRLDG